MPFDSRRIQVPENSEDYRQFIKDDVKEDLQLLDKKGRRKDGRDRHAMRKIFLKTGVVSQAKGSAYIEAGHTKILCSVFDPREKPRGAERNLRGDIYCEFKFASFSGKRRRAHTQEADDKEFSLLLKNALEPAVCLHEFPNFQVDVHVLVLQDDGSSLAAAITCAGLALADAAVPMYDLVVGAAKSMHGDVELLDPTSCEEVVSEEGREPHESHGMVTVALLPTFSQVAQLVQVGSAEPAKLETCLSELVRAGEEVHKAVQATLQSSIEDLMKSQKEKQDAENQTQTEIPSQ